MAETVRKTVWRAWKQWADRAKGIVPEGGCPLCERYMSRCERCFVYKQNGNGCTPLGAEGWDPEDEPEARAASARKVRDRAARFYKRVYGVHPSKESWAKESKK